MGMRFSLLVACVMLSIPSLAAECNVRSGPNTAALVELYTSEGCDSCPPADRWLSTFAGAPRASRLVVPIAFHVDYWNSLGWTDIYSDARYSERQRQLARAAGARMVYTPQVIVGGRDFASWRTGGAAKALDAVGMRPARAQIEMTASGTSARVVASVVPGTRTEDAALIVALTQNGIVTKVKAGENRGETLRHDFVVRDIKTFRAWSGERPTLSAEVDFPLRGDFKPGQMRFVAFVQDLRTADVLQALACP
jgi:hypothetical protein